LFNILNGLFLIKASIFFKIYGYTAPDFISIYPVPTCNKNKPKPTKIPPYSVTTSKQAGKIKAKEQILNENDIQHYLE